MGNKSHRCPCVSEDAQIRQFPHFTTAIVRPKWRRFCLHGAQDDRLQALQNQHCVAIAIKTVLLANRLVVGPANQFVAAERANQHQQRRSG